MVMELIDIINEIDLDKHNISMDLVLQLGTVPDGDFQYAFVMKFCGWCKRRRYEHCDIVRIAEHGRKVEWKRLSCFRRHWTLYTEAV